MEGQPKKRGPKPKPATPGTRVALGLVVSAEMKAWIDERAREGGRSQSREVERLVELGRQAQFLEDLGDAGRGVGEALQSMIAAANDVKRSVGDPATSLDARDELRRRWVAIAANALPQVSESAATAAAKAAISAMRYAALDARSEISRLAAPDDNLLAAAMDLLTSFNAGPLLHPGQTGWSEARAALGAAADSHKGAVADCLRNVISAADAAERAVARAERVNQ